MAAVLGAVVALVATFTVSAASPARAPAPARAALAAAAAAAAAAPATCEGNVLTRLTLDVAGTSRIAKLGSDIVLAPQSTFVATAFFNPSAPDPNILCILGDLNLKQVKDAYFVVLRFMPTTNDVDFIQESVIGRGRIVPPPPGQPPGLYVEAELVAKLFIKLSNVRQDGIDLKVGARCQTAVAAEIPIKAVLPPVIGAKVTVEATFGLPRFATCGLEENLEPLFTGLISGPGNLLRTTLTVTSVGGA